MDREALGGGDRRDLVEAQRGSDSGLSRAHAEGWRGGMGTRRTMCGKSSPNSTTQVRGAVPALKRVAVPDHPLKA